MKCSILVVTAALGSSILAMANAETVPAPEALVVDGVPAVPAELRSATAPYMESRTATFVGWNPQSKGILITTRFGNTNQVHEVAAPSGSREQKTFEREPVGAVGYAPGKGDVLVLSKDVGGDEFYQLYTLESGRLRLLTDGKSRNTSAMWNHEGTQLGYSSTRRNGTDSDLYLIDPRDPKSNRLVAQVQGGGWSFADFAPNGARALVINAVSVNQQELYQLELSTGKMTRLGSKKAGVVYGTASYGPDGTIYATSDEGSEFLRLGAINPKTSAFEPFALAGAQPWDVEDFQVAADNSFLAYVVNEAGISRLRLLEPSTRRALGEASLPSGVVSSLKIAPWGAIGFTLSSSQSPSDAYSVDAKTLAVTRWTRSETGGLDASRNANAELVRTKSFDGLEVSGFLYRPDATRFPGKRPLILVIHGGPE
ncbi:hypothetical protein, partial [Steroidobacter sp.]|uniref:S9 family peptidase n=1 Tax=Steroidobacter sp. TaxID=1978227 RepID=UPI001A45FD4E